MHRSFLAYENSRIHRVLGLLLVAFILYGTTVEAAHRHGRILPSNNGASSLFEAGNTSGLAIGKTGCSDCLICQLHQNFSTTLTSERSSDTKVQQRCSVAESTPVSAHSQIISPAAGRAPPHIS